MSDSCDSLTVLHSSEHSLLPEGRGLSVAKGLPSLLQHVINVFAAIQPQPVVLGV
jgi:hypothetical protein